MSRPAGMSHPFVVSVLPQLSARGSQWCRGLPPANGSARDMTSQWASLFVVHLRNDRHQLVHAMRTGMAGEDRLVPARGQVAGDARLLQQRAQVPRHLRAVAGDPKILAGGKQSFGVGPWRAD